MGTTVSPDGRVLMRGVDPRYPSDDGKRLAENGVQYRWIETLHGGVDAAFRDRPDVFVAADNLIYPVEGRPKIRRAPDVYVAFGVPKGDRGSFLVWEEGVFPQVVIEVRSPGNRAAEMANKLAFYDEYGADEYYDINPQTPPHRLRVYQRSGRRLAEVSHGGRFVSPRLGVRFEMAGPELLVYAPDGSRFLSRAEIVRRMEEDRRQSEADRRQSEADRRQSEADRRQSEADRRRAEALQSEVDRLRALIRQAGGGTNGAGG